MCFAWSITCIYGEMAGMSLSDITQVFGLKSFNSERAVYWNMKEKERRIENVSNVN